MGISTKLKSSVYEIGFFNTILYAIDSFLRKISNNRLCLYKYYLICQPVKSKQFIDSARKSAFIIRPILMTDVSIDSFQRPHHTVTSRYRQGAHCLAAFKDDTLVGFIWLIFGSYDEDEVRCRFTPYPPRQVSWDFDVYVAPRYRYTTAFLRLWDAANAFFRDRGITWTMSRISAFNFPSLSTHFRLGGKVIGSACFLLVGRFQFMCTTLPPYFHFSPGSVSFPEIVLKPK